MLLDFSETHLARLKEQIEGCNYCFVYDCHPGEDHRGHDPTCPLRKAWCEEPARKAGNGFQQLDADQCAEFRLMQNDVTNYNDWPAGQVTRG